MSVAGARARGALSRWIGTGVVLAVLVSALAWGLGRLREQRAARAAFPLVSGVVRIDGPAAPVDVYRDARGVPHVEAKSEPDAWLGLGFAHAQDRLTQMLWLRRQARGRTAEVVGPTGLEADRLARLLDIGSLADAQVSRLPAEVRRILEAYAEGVNARLERIERGTVPPPPGLPGLPGLAEQGPVEPWTPGDSLALVKLWAWTLADSLRASLVLEDLVQRLGGQEARPFFPESPGVKGIPAPPEYRVALDDPARPAWPAERGLGALTDALGLGGQSLGSSAWVLGGRHAQGGRPLLVADLHEPPTAPALFYEAHVRGGDLDVAGATLPGVPVVWVGRSPDVAWAATHARAVTVDLFVETLREEEGETRYHDGKRWRPLWEREEVLRVRNADGSLREERFVVRGTRHGPLLAPLLASERAPLALSWTGARRGDGVQAMLGVAHAHDAADVIEALRSHHEPVIALVYADREGAAGMQVAGWVPQRALPTGLQPVPGRARFYDWRRPVPFDELPASRLEDGEGWVLAADEPFATPSGSPPIEWLWRTGERASRLESLLRRATARGGLRLRDLASFQDDVRSPAALAFVASLRSVAGEQPPLGPEAREVLDLLEEWDGDVSADSRGAATYHVLLEHLTRELFLDALGEDLFDRYRALPHTDATRVAREVVVAAAEGGEPGGWSDPERVRGAVRDALRQTWFALSYRLGANRDRWAWGRLHALAFLPFGGLQAPGSRGEPVRGPYPYGGDQLTLHHAAYDSSEPFAVRAVSAYRFAADLAAADQSLSAWAPGQSENPLHPHYDDGIEPWLAGRLGLLLTSPLVVEESSVARLTLEPGS